MSLLQRLVPGYRVEEERWNPLVGEFRFSCERAVYPLRSWAELLADMAAARWGADYRFRVVSVRTGETVHWGTPR